MGKTELKHQKNKVSNKGQTARLQQGNETPLSGHRSPIYIMQQQALLFFLYRLPE